MIWIGPYGILPALRTALGHDGRPSAARRADNHDRGPFCGPSKFHNALTNHVITIITTSRFLYRFSHEHADIYCLGTKVHWPNSPRDQGPYTRDQGPLTKFSLAQGPKRDGNRGQMEEMSQQTGK